MGEEHDAMRVVIQAFSEKDVSVCCFWKRFSKVIAQHAATYLPRELSPSHSLSQATRSIGFEHLTKLLPILKNVLCIRTGATGAFSELRRLKGKKVRNRHDPTKVRSNREIFSSQHLRAIPSCRDTVSASRSILAGCQSADSPMSLFGKTVPG